MDAELRDAINQNRDTVVQHWLAALTEGDIRTAGEKTSPELKARAEAFVFDLGQDPALFAKDISPPHCATPAVLTSTLASPQRLDLWAAASLLRLHASLVAVLGLSRASVSSEALGNTLLTRILLLGNQRLGRERQMRDESQWSLIAKMSDSFVVFDHAWRYSYINDAAATVLKVSGLDPSALLGQVVWDVLPELEASNFGQAFRRAFEQRVEVHVSDYYAPANLYYRTSVFPTIEGGVAAIISEVPVTDAAKRALSAQQHRFQSIFEAASGIAVVDHHGKLIRVNQSFCDLLGFTNDELLGQCFRVFTHPEDIEAELRLFDQLVNGQIEGYEIEKRYCLRGGKFIWVLLRVGVLRGDEGRAEAYIGSVMDISARKETERALLATARAKDEFLAILSHELRTPLSAIVSCTELLDFVAPGSPEHREVLETIQRNVDAETRIIDDILDVSRIITGKLPLTIESYQLSEVVAGAMSAVQFAMENKGLTFTSSLDGAVPALLGDRDRMQQVIWNLLSNAIKFTPRGGSVRLTTQRAGDSVLITVTDTGAGIEPNFLGDVFLRFSQQDSSPSRVYQGLGLGLAIVKQVVEAHGGTVEAQSEGRGCGASFTVHLPLKTQGAPAGIRSSGRPLAPSGDHRSSSPKPSGKRILVVDDHRDAVRLTTLLLNRLGIRNQGVCSGPEALALLAAGEHFDLVLSDISMPLMDGYQLLSEVRAYERSHGRPPVVAIALSAFVSQSDQQRSLEAGFAAHLTKPLKVADLTAALAKAFAEAGR